MQPALSPSPRIRVSDIVTVLKVPEGKVPGCAAKVVADGGNYLGVRFDIENRSEPPTWVHRDDAVFFEHSF